MRGSCPVPPRMFSNISGLYPPNASRSRPPHSSHGNQKIVSRQKKYLEAKLLLFENSSVWKDDWWGLGREREREVTKRTCNKLNVVLCIIYSFQLVFNSYIGGYEEPRHFPKVSSFGSRTWSQICLTLKLLTHNCFVTFIFKESLQSLWVPTYKV